MLNETQKTLQDFGKYIVQQSRTNLTKGSRNVSKGLYESLKYNVKVSKRSFQFDIEMEQYGIFQDKGVRGKSSSAKAPNSPFRFGSGTGKKGGLTDSIKAWVRRKSFRMLDKETGKPMGLKSKAFIITRAIYQKGIKPTNFFTKPFEAGSKKLPDDLLNAFGLDVESMLKLSLKNGSKEI